MPKKLDIAEIVDTALNPYLATSKLLSEWLAQKTSIHEFLILACARLDSLSNLACPRDTQKKCFSNFLRTYSSHRHLFEKVSVPDLYYFLCYQAWVLPGTVEKPGRLHMFDPKRDATFMTFLWNSEVALSEKDIRHLLGFVVRTLRNSYRVAPNQKLSMPTTETKPGLVGAIKAGASKYRRGIYNATSEAIRPLLEDFTLASLLYNDYRCAAIHGYRINISEALFFKSKAPYWCPYYHDLARPGRFLKLHFPGAFLLDALQECTENYKRHLKSVRKLPADLFLEFFDTLTDLEYLDDASIAPGKDLRITNL